MKLNSINWIPVRLDMENATVVLRYGLVLSFFNGSIRIVTKVFLNITLYVQFTFRAQN